MTVDCCEGSGGCSRASFVCCCDGYIGVMVDCCGGCGDGCSGCDRVLVDCCGDGCGCNTVT